MTLLAFFCSKSLIQYEGTSGRLHLLLIRAPLKYLARERPDTIRSIVANLVGDEDTGDSLVDDNEPPQPLHQVEIEDYSDPNWEPEPIDAGPSSLVFLTATAVTQLLLLLSLQISEQTNTPMFLALWSASMIRTTFSSRSCRFYLHNVSLRSQMEILKRLNERSVPFLVLPPGSFANQGVLQRRNIEILKIRFGEAALQVCEVMLKDMTDSKRIDGHVQSQMAVSGCTEVILMSSDYQLRKSIVHPTIISKHFWPMLGSDEIIMPGQFQTYVLSAGLIFSGAQLLGYL